MGGDTLKYVVVEEEEPSSNLDISRSSSSCSCCFRDDLEVSEENISNFAADLRKREKTYQEILQSHDLLQETLGKNNRKLKLARRQILSYTPGSFADLNLSDNDFPKTTSILIVGPKGAGKSSLVNRITRVIQDDEFAPAMAQESYGTLSNGGTFFVHEYMIPRPRGGSASFCLYDTRGLSQISSSDNASMIEQWITKGVHHGEPVIWTSDNSDLKNRLIRDGCTGCETRKVNSVIFVVNAVEILKSMESETSYAHMISTAFNSPLLSVRDDKPAVVITHGDILSREERARVQVFLGELVGIPPDKQIFDIPAETALTVCNLLRHCLEHADKNLRVFPKRNFTKSKVEGDVRTRLTMVSIALTLFLALAIICFIHEDIAQNVTHKAQHELRTFRRPLLYNLTHMAQRKVYTLRPRPLLCNLTLHEVQPKRRIGPQLVIGVGGQNYARILNQESNSVPNGEPIIDWRTTRGLWFDEGKVAKAESEPSFDWRTTRRLWYVE